MSWPTPQDYNEAIQNPRLSFGDPELRAGAPELTSLGLPRPITGNFASVYRMHCDGCDWAVRCFWREFADLQERYRAISFHLKAANLPYTVGFEYLPEGIRVRGQWYPILKMEWVEGVLLNDYIKSHLQEPAALSLLPARWLAMVHALERASVAHGDLQHGNILVVNGDFKLVDYDGMFVPALAGRCSHELGHQNYQHPARTAHDYGPALDRFSAWVIYVALLAVSRDPQLWTEVNDGDESLLLGKEDFAGAAPSPTLCRLEQHGDAAVRAITVRFHTSLSHGPKRFPPLESLNGDVSGARAHLRGWAGSAFPDAWRPHRSPARVTDSDLATLPEWLHASLDPTPVGHRSFASSMLMPRLILAAGEAILLVPYLTAGLPELTLLWRAVTLALLAIGLLLAGLTILYHRDREVIARRRIAKRRQEHVHALASIERQLQRYATSKERLDRREARLRDRAAQKLSAVESRHTNRQESIQATFKESLDLLDEQLRALERWEKEARAECLLLVQARYLAAFVHRHSIWSAPVPSAGRVLKLRLWLAGIRTAADINADHSDTLKRYDPSRIKSLIAWRLSLQREAQRALPRTLPPLVEGRIEARCRRLRARYSGAWHLVEALETTVLQAAAHRRERETGAIGQRLAEIEGSYERKRKAIEVATAEVRKHQPFHNRELTEASRQLQAFEDISFTRYVRAVSHVL